MTFLFDFSRLTRRVPYDERNNPPQHPRTVYPPILDINHFCHFLVTLENLYLMDNEPMWAADRVFALTPGSAITIPKTANEFAIKGNGLKLPWSQSVQSIDVIDEILEEDFNALLDEGSKILHSIKGTLLEEEIFVEFDEFMAMTADKNSNSKFDTEEPPFEKITINTDYKIKTSIEEPPINLKLKPLPDNMEYVFLKEPSFLLVIISSQLSKEKKDKLVSVLKKHKQSFAWKTTDILGFGIEIKDKKGIYNVAADHLSRIENDETSDDSEFDDNFHGETLMEINTKDEPCSHLSEETILPFRNAQSSNQRPRGQVENTNKALKRILKKTVKDNPAIWSRKLDDALWAFRTAYKTPTGTTPYKLIYGQNYHLPFKIEHRAYWALKNCNPDLIAAGEKRMFQLHELDALRHQAYENSRLYKETTKFWHDGNLSIRKEFKQGNKVPLLHSKPRNAAWLKEKLMLAKAHEAGQILDEEQLAFLADPGISEALDVQEMQCFKQTHVDDFEDNKIHSALKNELRKLKGKNLVNTMVSKPNATIAPGMFKLDIEPISARLKNNRDAHEELLVYASQTCPNSPKPSEKLVDVTPINKDKRVKFAEPVTS
nr:reverse transcriptase domain-containing protein [Tanacetum cinerariifolium]